MIYTLSNSPHIEPLWPPPYKLRYSARAKNANLKIHPITGLEITLPARSKNFDINKLLVEKRNWLEKHWPLIVAANNPRVISLPTHIFIPADKSLWKINYYQAVAIDKIPVTVNKPAKLLRLTVNKHAKLLVFTGKIELSLVQKKLIAWLKKYAYTILDAKLKQISLDTGLAYNQMAIRSQSTVWGSCNHQKNISLNMKLLFLPTQITEYVLLHELCHTKYLNHGRRFWQLVHKFKPNYSTLEPYLKYGDKYLPAWLSHHAK